MNTAVCSESVSPDSYTCRQHLHRQTSLQALSSSAGESKFAPIFLINTRGENRVQRRHRNVSGEKVWGQRVHLGLMDRWAITGHVTWCGSKTQRRLVFTSTERWLRRDVSTLRVFKLNFVFRVTTLCLCSAEVYARLDNCLFYSKWNHNLHNERHTELKKTWN